MKKLLAGLLALTLALPFPVIAGMIETDRAEVEGFRNYMPNPGFESGKAKHVASLASTLTVTTTTPIFGAASGVFTPTIAAQTVSQSFAVPEGLKGKNCALTFDIKTTVTDAKLQVWNGTSVINEVTITPSTIALTHPLNFACPTTGNIGYRILAGSSFGAITYDGGQLKDARGVNLQNVSQSYVVGKWYGATLTLSAVDTAIPFPSTAFSSDSNMNTTTGVYTVRKDGRYTVKAFISTVASTGVATLSLNANQTGSASNTTLMGRAFKISAANTSKIVNGSVTFDCKAGDTLYVSANDSDAIALTTAAYLEIAYSPTSSQLAVTPDLSSAFAASEWGVAGCYPTITGSSFATMDDVDCNFPATKYGKALDATVDTLSMTVSIVPVGTYLAIAGGNYSPRFTSTATSCVFELYDGTTETGLNFARALTSTEVTGGGQLMGLFNYTTPQTNKTYSIRAKKTAGGGSCSAECDGADGTCSISLIPLSQSLPAPIIVVNPINEYVFLYADNGYGSSSLKVRKYAAVSSAGTSLSYTQSAAQGDSVTINTDGLYEVSGNVRYTIANQTIYTMINTTDGTNAGPFPTGNTITYTDAVFTGAHTIFSRVVRLTAGVIVRMITATDSLTSSNGPSQFLSVRKVGN